MTRVALLRGADTIYERALLSDVSGVVGCGETQGTTTHYRKERLQNNICIVQPVLHDSSENLAWAPLSHRQLAAAELYEGFINRKQTSKDKRQDTRWKTARTDGQTEEGERRECQFSGSRPPSAEGWSSRQSAGSEFKPLIAPLKQHGLQVVRSHLTSVRPLILADTNVSAFKLRQKRKEKKKQLPSTFTGICPVRTCEDSRTVKQPRIKAQLQLSFPPLPWFFEIKWAVQRLHLKLPLHQKHRAASEESVCARRCVCNSAPQAWQTDLRPPTDAGRGHRHSLSLGFLRILLISHFSSSGGFFGRPYGILDTSPLFHFRFTVRSLEMLDQQQLNTVSVWQREGNDALDMDLIQEMFGKCLSTDEPKGRIWFLVSNVTHHLNSSSSMRRRCESSNTWLSLNKSVTM